ncbi:hypothetical protein AVEN_173946-1, partial [Araneus ventricosus]
MSEGRLGGTSGGIEWTFTYLEIRFPLSEEAKSDPVTK